MLVAELFDLLSDLPVEVVLLALCTLGLHVVHLAKYLGADRTVWWVHLFDGLGSEVNAAFRHGWVHNLGCAHEGRTARCVIAHASATDALFVLLVAQ